MSKEIWKPVVGAEGLYEVSDRGRVRSVDRSVISKRGHAYWLWGRILRPRCRGGYLHVSICVKGKKNNRAVAHLVAEAFIGPRPAKLHLAHLNGRSGDNRPRNLTYVTVQENSDHKFIHGTWARGSRHGNARLTERQVLEIRRRYVSRCPKNGTKALSREYGVHRNTILDAASGRWWAHLGVNRCTRPLQGQT